MLIAISRVNVLLSPAGMESKVLITVFTARTEMSETSTALSFLTVMVKRTLPGIV